MRQIDLLWQLQDIDSLKYELERELDVYNSKDKLRGIKRKFDTEKTSLCKNEVLLKEAVKSSRNNRAKAEELKNNCKKTEEKLYNGSVSNAKQLEGMQRNLEEMQRNIQSLEAASKMVEDERKALEEKVRVSKRKLIRYKKIFDALKEKYITGEERAKKEYEVLLRERQELVKKIEGRVLNRYNRVRSGINTAVVMVEEGKCSGCHMEVSVVCIQRLKEEELLNCETCGRILYLKKDNGGHDG